MPACRTALSTDSNVLTSCGLGKCARAWSEARACRWAFVAFRSPAGGVVVAGSDPSQLCCSWAHSLEVHGFGSSRNSNCGCSLYGTHPSPHTADKSVLLAHPDESPGVHPSRYASMRSPHAFRCSMCCGSKFQLLGCPVAGRPTPFSNGWRCIQRQRQYSHYERRASDATSLCAIQGRRLRALPTCQCSSCGKHEDAASRSKTHQREWLLQDRSA